MKFLKENKWYLIFLMAFAFTLYSQTISYDFIFWDDDKQITENPTIKNISQENIAYNLKYERYTALSLFTYSIDYALWGQDPAAFRTVNILLHTFNVLLVFLFICLLGFNPRVAFFTAVLFACHPLRVESVVWISERKDVLFAFWGLLSLIFYRHYIVNDSRKYFILAVIFAILSAFSKIQGILIPTSFFLIDYWYGRKTSLRMALEKLALIVFIFFIFRRFALIAFTLYLIWFLLPEKKKEQLIPWKFKFKPWLVITLSSVILAAFIIYLYFSNVLGIWEINTISHSGIFNFTDRLFLATYSIAHYLLKFIAPFSLSAIYPYPVKTEGLLPVMYYFSILLLIPLIWYLILVFRKNRLKPVYIFGGLFFLLNISMVTHILPIEGRLVAADRYTYIAYLGLFLILSDVLYQHVQKIRWQWIIMICLTIALSLTNFFRQPVWKNTGSLFSSVLEKDSTLAFALNNLATYRLYQNQKDEALVLINKSLQYDETDPMSWYNKGLILFNKGKYDEAILSYQTIYKYARNTMDTALAMNDIGQSLIAQGKTEEGVYSLHQAIQIYPKLTSVYNNLGWYYYNKNQSDSAEYMFRKALHLNPDYAEACNNLGSVLLSKGRTDSVLYYFDRSVQYKPFYSLAHNNKGFYLLQKNDIKGALQSFNRAIESDSLFLQAYLNRAWIYFSQKEYTQAVHDYDYILKHDSTNIGAYTNRAFSWHMLQKYEKGIADFTKVIELQPGNPESFFNRGRAYTEMKNFKAAIPDFNTAIQKKPDEMTYQYRAYCYYQIEKYEEAQNDFLESIKLKPENPDCYYFLSLIAEKKHYTEKACEYLEKAAELGHVQAQKERKEKCKEL
ncbi:MAG: hypothetical protein CVU05_04260 [Bacteroidetes bacterium HGW-Bacteroidetes-21]|nr:MAG: hypothetical protein CVU05_04260 [Bacteroidetes bacterium HGW-Bacteroidetes-21]